MTRLFRRSCSAVALLVLLAAGGMAGAATQTYTATLSPSITDFTSVLTVPAFDPTKGTLTGVTISFTDAGSFSGTVKNTSSSPQSFNVYEESDIELTGPGVKFGSTTTKSGLSLIAQQTYPMLGTGVTGYFGPSQAYGQSGVLAITSIPAMAAFSTPTPVSFDLATMTSVSISGGGGNIQTKIVTTASATLSIQYNYNPAAASVTVPEPASLLMMGLGLAGVGALALRRKARRAVA